MNNKKPRFSLGDVLATPGSLDALTASGESVEALLARHAACDWGDLSQEDKDLNDAALVDGSRILSVYRTRLGVKLWVITEAEDDNGNRAATTILLPDEY
jgi:hypothetical protein